MPSLFGHKTSSDLPALFPADGDILQIGVAAAEATRCRDGLVKGCVEPACDRISQFDQAVQVRGLQFGDGPIAQEKFGHLERERCKPGQHLYVSRMGARFERSLENGELELLEKYRAQLLGRIDVKFHACLEIDFLF